jgi:hypothetical protein
MYLNTASGDVYRYDGFEWIGEGNLTGPEGAVGAKGEKGEDGADAVNSDSANTAGGSNAVGSASAASAEKGGNGIAVVSLVLGIVLLIGNIVFMAMFFLGKKKKA